MNNIELVMAMLDKLGPSTSKELAEQIPDLTTRQVRQALCNGSLTGHCRLMDKGSGTIGGLWERGDEKSDAPAEHDWDAEAPRGQLGWIGRVSSVWQLGAQA